jgi:phosphoribosyl 1,2-cyclic phosphodiesterase
MAEVHDASRRRPRPVLPALHRHRSLDAAHRRLQRGGKVPVHLILTFLGTRANIPIRSPQHRRHSSLLVSTGRRRLLVDCGTDWRGRLDRIHPTAILVTHTHPDHADGLRAGATCPVYAADMAWEAMRTWPLKICGQLPLDTPVVVAGFIVECRAVEHSLNAPAVGYSISAGNERLFYVPDVAALVDPVRTLRDVYLYIGDGATLTKSLLRRHGRALIGHAALATQLAWCREAGVARAVFTHCGSGLVRMRPSRAAALVSALGHAHGVNATLAYDGLVLGMR